MNWKENEGNTKIEICIRQVKNIAETKVHFLGGGEGGVPSYLERMFYTNFVLLRVENIVGKGENAGYEKQNHKLAFANNKINAIQKIIMILLRVENIVGKGENAGYQHFLLFPQCFRNSISLWTLFKTRDLCGECVKLNEMELKWYRTKRNEQGKEQGYRLMDRVFDNCSAGEV